MHHFLSTKPSFAKFRRPRSANPPDTPSIHRPAISPTALSPSLTTPSVDSFLEQQPTPPLPPLPAYTTVPHLDTLPIASPSIDFQRPNFNFSRPTPQTAGSDLVTLRNPISIPTAPPIHMLQQDQCPKSPAFLVEILVEGKTAAVEFTTVFQTESIKLASFRHGGSKFYFIYKPQVLIAEVGELRKNLNWCQPTHPYVCSLDELYYVLKRYEQQSLLKDDYRILLSFVAFAFRENLIENSNDKKYMSDLWDCASREKARRHIWSLFVFNLTLNLEFSDRGETRNGKLITLGVNSEGITIDVAYWHAEEVEKARVDVPWRMCLRLNELGIRLDPALAQMIHSIPDWQCHEMSRDWIAAYL